MLDHNPLQRSNLDDVKRILELPWYEDLDARRRSDSLPAGGGVNEATSDMVLTALSTPVKRETPVPFDQMMRELSQNLRLGPDAAIRIEVDNVRQISDSTLQTTSMCDSAPAEETPKRLSDERPSPSALPLSDGTTASGQQMLTIPSKAVFVHLSDI